MSAGSRRRTAPSHYVIHDPRPCCLHSNFRTASVWSPQLSTRPGIAWRRRAFAQPALQSSSHWMVRRRFSSISRFAVVKGRRPRVELGSVPYVDAVVPRPGGRWRGAYRWGVLPPCIQHLPQPPHSAETSLRCDSGESALTLANIQRSWMYE